MNTIRIDLVRDDGHATRLVGKSGLASCMGELAEAAEKSSPPAVSLRCDSATELAWNLAALMAAVRHVSPAAFEAAFSLMPLCDFKQPEIERQLPRREAE